MASATKLSMGESLQLNVEIQELMKEDTIPFSLKYDLAKLFEKTSKISENFYKTKTDIFKKYGDLSEDGLSYSLENAKEKEKAQKELDKLMGKNEDFPESFDKEDFKDLKSKNPYFVIMKFL